MKKFLKTTALIITAVILLLGILTAAVIIMFPPEKIKGILLTELTEITGRKAEIRELNINIFTGIEVKGLVLYEADKKSVFVSDESLLIRYSIPALFNGALLIKELKLNEPYFSIVKKDKDRWNYSDIVLNINEKFSGKKKKSGSSKEFSVIITQLTVKNGIADYSDFSREKPVKARIEKINLNSDNLIISAVKPVEIKLSGEIIYQELRLPCDIVASAGINVLKGDVKISMNKISLPGILSSGNLEISGWKEIKGSVLSDIDTQRIVKILPASYSEKIKNIATSLTLKNRIDFSVKDKKLSFLDKLSPTGGIIAFNGKPVVEKLTGELAITDKFDLKGAINLLLAGSPVYLKISAIKVNLPKDSSYEISIKSPKFAVEYLISLFPSKKEQSDETGAARKEAKTKEAVAKFKSASLPDIYINLDADSVTFKEITLGKTIANIRQTKGKVFTEAAAAAYGGNINFNLTADINRESYEAGISIKKVVLDKLINDAITVIPRKDPKKKTLLDEIKGKASGTFNLKAGMSGNSYVDLAHTIKGSGEFSVINGKLSSLDTARDIALKTGLKFLKEDITFDVMAAEYKMEKGRIDINNFRILTGPDGRDGMIKVRGLGYLTVDKAVDLKFQTDLNPKSSKEIEEMLSASLGIKDVSYGYDKDGWLPFDFRLYGSLNEKKYDYSQPRLVANIQRNLAKKVQEQGTKYIREEGEKLIKKLFGK